MAVAEAEGIFTAGSSPFCFGMANQSEAGYGLPLPFSYNLLKLAVSGISTDATPEFFVKFVHYPVFGGTPVVLANGILLNKQNVIDLGYTTSSPGNLVVEVVSVNNMTDENAKFRLNFVLTSNDSLEVP